MASAGQNWTFKNGGGHSGEYFVKLALPRPRQAVLKRQSFLLKYIWFYNVLSKKKFPNNNCFRKTLIIFHNLIRQKRLITSSEMAVCICGKSWWCLSAEECWGTGEPLTLILSEQTGNLVKWSVMCTLKIRGHSPTKCNDNYIYILLYTFLTPLKQASKQTSKRKTPLWKDLYRVIKTGRENHWNKSVWKISKYTLSRHRYRALVMRDLFIFRSFLNWFIFINHHAYRLSIPNTKKKKMTEIRNSFCGIFFVCTK